MTQKTFEKEAYLKDLVIKLLQEKNLSDYDMLDSLFAEIKQELQNQKKRLDQFFTPRIRHKNPDDWNFII